MTTPTRSEFVASNRAIVWLDTSGYPLVDCRNVVGHTPDDTTTALREYFQHEADERLGRWRWTACDPSYVIYEGGIDEVIVLNERNGSTLRFGRDQVAGGSSFKPAHAAWGYFAAHPRPEPPKPWHDAQAGDVWIVKRGLGDQCVAYSVVQNGARRWFTRATVQGYVRTLELTDTNIVDARRIWPAEGEA